MGTYALLVSLLLLLALIVQLTSLYLRSHTIYIYFIGRNSHQKSMAIISHGILMSSHFVWDVYSIKFEDNKKIFFRLNG